jgi:hypothetical protein
MKRWWPILALLAVLAVLYLAYPSRTHEYDAMVYASAALRGEPWLAADPGHLAFGPLEIVATGIGQRVHPPLNPILLLQYLSMAAGLAGIYVFYRTLTGLGVGPLRATVFAGILSCTYAYWHFALQAESHVLSTAFLLFYLWQITRLAESGSPGAAVWAGALLGLATLMHQKNVLLVAPALIALPVAARGGRRLAAVVGLFLLTYGAVTILPYLVAAVGVAGLRTIPDLRHWVMGISNWHRWGHWSGQTVLLTGESIVRSLVGSHFLLGLGPTQALVVRLSHGLTMQDELAVAAAVPPAVRVALFPLEAALLVLAAAALGRRAGSLKTLFARRAPLAAFLAAWILVVGVFSAWWVPWRLEFWIDLFPPLLLLLALPRDQDHVHRSGHYRVSGAFLLALATVNFFGSIRPESLATTDTKTNLALALDAAIKPGDAIVADIPLRGRTSQGPTVFVPASLLDGLPPRAGPAQAAQFHGVDSLLAAADSAGKCVYVVATPLASELTGNAAYRRLVASLGTRFSLDEKVPIRANIDLRKLHRRPGELR